MLLEWLKVFLLSGLLTIVNKEIDFLEEIEMKKFENAELVAMDLTATAFGPSSPENPDEAKDAVLDDNGNIIGYRQRFGQSSDSDVVAEN